MGNETLHCDLCGMPIKGEPVVRDFGGEKKHFCCEGCANAYQAAQENDMLDQVLPHTPDKPLAFSKVRLAPRERAHFSVDGMWCPGCAVAAEQVLRKQPGVRQVDVSFAAEQGRIEYDPNQVDPAAVLKTLDGLGYRARLKGDPKAQQAEKKQERTLLQLLTSAAFGMQVMLLYLVQLYPQYAAGQFNDPDVRRIQYLAWALATPVFLVGGSSFLRGAWRSLRARTATMDTLVALGTLSAYSYSAYVAMTGSGEVYFDSVVMITTFITLGRYLETLGGSQARKDIRKLLQLQPQQAWRRNGEDWEQVDAAALQMGDVILVKPGERAPADALIQEGAAAVDESLLTGESNPVDKDAGDALYAGTVVTDEALIARVTSPVQATRLAQITALVEQTLADKPPIQRLADKASTHFAFGIVGVALLTALGWWVSGHSLAQSLLNAVAVLVVACPCALGLATPLAITVTLGLTTRAGILVRRAAALEMAGQIQRIVLDKTGTLTRGLLEVTTALVHPGVEIVEKKLLCLAAAVEQFSEHPLARAIVKACPDSPPRGQNFKVQRGLGVSAVVPALDGARVQVGSSQFLNQGEDGPLTGQAQAHTERGETVVWVGWSDRVAGLIGLRDEPNPTARKALRRLEESGVRAIMLSGDDPRTTSAIAKDLDLSEYEGGCPPAEKAARIRQWQEAGELVAMVGDGVNDAPALAQADLSITTAGGTDVAGETSDIVLTRQDLDLIPWLIELSRRTRRIIRENLSWAFAYNLIAVPLAAFGIISPAIAAAAMATSSLLVVGNSLRLRR